MIESNKQKCAIKIGDVEINSKVALAPLAGITDYVLRHLIRQYSKTCLLTTEMISSEALVQRVETNITHTDEKEHPVSFQIEGHKPDLMAHSAKILEKKASIIDINMGCPIKKIVNGNDGCSLMKNPDLAREIVLAVKEAVNIPITCKFRLGWSQDTKNFVEFAQMLQEAGVSAVTVHGRTRSQMYSGVADWQEISKLKGEIDIPYFANGDIVSPETAFECLQVTKADGIAIGRAAMGDLSLLYRIEKYINDGILLKEPDLNEKIMMLKKHLDMQIAFRGEETGIKFFRKFYPSYIRNVRGGAEYRHRLVTELNYQKIEEILNEILQDTSS